MKGYSAVVLLWSVGTIVMGSLVSFFVPIYSYTRVLFVVPAYIVLLSLGLGKIPRYYAYGMIALNILFCSIFWFTPRFHREDWRSLTHDLNSFGDGIVVMPSLNQDAPFRYYDLKLSLSEAKNGEKITSHRVYYIKYVEDLFDPEKKGQENLQAQGYTITRSITYPGIEVNIYENNY
jgi:hypothetical protein